MKKLFFLILLICKFSIAQDFALSNAANSELQISRDEKGQKSCGTHTMLVYSEPLRKRGTRAIDFSLVIYSTATTAIKFGVVDISESNGQITPISRQEKMFLAVPARNINLASEFPMQSESNNYTLAAIKDTASALAVLTAIAIGETMHVQIPRKGESIYTTVQFSAPFSIPEQQALNDCIGNLIDRLQKEYDIK